MDNSKAIETLNDIIQITEDSNEGYRESAKDAKDADLKTLFTDLASQRASMVRELQDMVTRLGGQPSDSATILGSAHRFFVNLKSAVTGQDREAVLKEVERGESEAVRRHENALQVDALPAEARSLIQRHLERFRSDRDRMTALKRTA
ncbi:PA2169 family four-helix-bundle protein [Arenibaculum pallidiluteum]|uniref:PA2169 family four-helix-bundle protein n=1 Tax=Arenibaculum pallidiluteum TaxID=2812559 RepID=UPI001A95C43C|nr:PA2169 family four-helix-bundle protein [Arenibaculum pallidiluteum]